MESYDDFQNRYGWYRTTLHRDATGPLALRLAGYAGMFTTFLNGQLTTLDHLDAKAGDNSLAILVKAGPRSKVFGFLGPIGKRNATGIWGGLYFDGSLVKPDITWKQNLQPDRPGKLAAAAGSRTNSISGCF